MRGFAAVLALAFGFGLAGAVQAQEAASATKRVGTVDLFGYAGWDRDDPNTAALWKKLAARVGAEVKLGATASFKRQVQGDVVAVTGKPATDVAVICCNEKGDLSVFVGMEGESAIPLEQRATPTGSDALPAEALALYAKEEKAWQAADTLGSSAEDDSHGYALAKDAATRAVQEQMRAFAVSHADVIVRVLRRSGMVEQRRAAATLLGYADRSPAQVRGLQDGMNDDDDAVRNNAVRALAVMAQAGPLPGLNVQQIIGLLYSGVWTDRNKASALLLGLTAKHDAKILKALGDEALPPLIEGTRWQSKAHAFAFAMVLGRVAGISDERSSELINSGHAAEIATAASVMEKKGKGR